MAGEAPGAMLQCFSRLFPFPADSALLLQSKMLDDMLQFLLLMLNDWRGHLTDNKILRWGSL